MQPDYRFLDDLTPASARVAFDAGLYQPDGVREEMACQPDRLGGIVSTSRETLDEGKLTVSPVTVSTIT